MNNPFSQPLERIFVAASGSGSPTGGWALAGAWLECLSAMYRCGVQAKNAAYGMGLFKPVRLPWPTISVGNLTLGGTGKTPMVRWLAEYLAESGRSVVVLSRGYGKVDSSRCSGMSDSLSHETVTSDDEAFGIDVTRHLMGGTAGTVRPVRELADAIRTELEKKKRGDDASTGVRSSAARGASTAGGQKSRCRLGPDAQVLRVACPERARAASDLAPVLERLGGKWVFLLDDGFQHRKLSRDLDIVMVSCLEPLTGARLFPSGAFREPPSSLQRAHVVVLTHVDIGGESAARRMCETIRRLAPAAAVVESSHGISWVRILASPHDRIPGMAQSGEAMPNVPLPLLRRGEGWVVGEGESRGLSSEPSRISASAGPDTAGGSAGVADREPKCEDTGVGGLKGKRVLAFCGIGKPSQFVRSLTSAGVDVIASVSFPDHHNYATKDIATIVARAVKNRADLLVTTEKDSARLRGHHFPLPLAVVGVELEFVSGIESLKAEVSRLLG